MASLLLAVGIANAMLPAMAGLRGVPGPPIIRHAVARMMADNQPLGGGATAGTAAVVTSVVKEVSKSVASSEIEAPEARSSFVSMDSERAGLVDDEGLPLIYDKEAIQAYWSSQGSALQKRWLEFLGVAVPLFTRVATLLVSGGTDRLQAEAASLARQAREGIEELGPTYVKMGQMMSVRPDVLPQAALDELAVLQDGVEGFERAVAIAMVSDGVKHQPLDDLPSTSPSSSPSPSP